MTHFWPDGLAVKADTETGEESLHGQLFGLLAAEVPRSLSWENNQHRVEEIFSVWRVDINWWRTRSWRTYFLLATKSGLLITIYQDLTSGNWYLQRLFD